MTFFSAEVTGSAPIYINGIKVSSISVMVILCL